MSEAQSAQQWYFYLTFGLVGFLMLLAILFRRKPVGETYREAWHWTDKIRRLM